MAINVLSIRTEMGLSRRAMALRLGCSQTSLAKWERSGATPAYIVLAALAIRHRLDILL